ncbi:DUF2326 domain-containing protein [Clostridium chauvoei]|uniref:DUF2326 domain-containing protein n=2 Tax=Clostridium chauvoei TaxID=46867 RepID=A0A1U6JME2_9CLOT|nr:DUF2326 domain-containing protein [Clostridium chauvoei]ATD55766.1 hypothetical protein BTM20_11185 [Clostridium chauvoei]ATD56558.1 hypothetical protein BTM21_01835 [Clostridium chauvoei]MBX7280311.1 DUF2326 domain-containing protein [Clostridium chauvoei]MBX7282796.1 DUF2326 domain-containing protein [Clostridium chauvoei]MBX7285202.1 DUF2326 domain-containing protein [Clostridium chauvoei]
MKILNLKIINKEDIILRDINFNENGISYIYGDIQDPKNKRGTSNSLGKTLLLKFINYIYGANEDSSISKGELNGYKLSATIKYNGKEQYVSRIIGNSKEITLDGKVKTLGEYKDLLNIDRGLYSKQIIINKKSSIISFNSNPNKEDNINFINLLNIDGIINNINEIYKAQNKIKSLKNNKMELISLYDGIKSDTIDEEIYFVEKEVNKLESQIEEVSNKIKCIEISGLQRNVIEEYEIKNKELKKLNTLINRLNLELERLTKFIEDSNKIDITSEHIIAIYNKSMIEVPQLVKKKLKDVEVFHKKVYEERKDFLGKKKEEIQKEIIEKEEKTSKLAKQIDKLGEILATNQIYQESVMLYEDFNNKLQNLKFNQGKLSQIKEIDDAIMTEDSKLTDNFESSSEELKKYYSIIEEYRDYIYNITKDIYDENVNSYFDIKIRKKHQTSRPLNIEFTLKGDTGEGVNEVKKNIVDYLILKYNNIIDILIQDSACYNGIDPRQVCGLLRNLSEFSSELNKQTIIAINKYQLGDNTEFINKVIENSAIILSEKDKLLKFNF